MICTLVILPIVSLIELAGIDGFSAPVWDMSNLYNGKTGPAALVAVLADYPGVGATWGSRIW